VQERGRMRRFLNPFRSRVPCPLPEKKREVEPGEGKKEKDRADPEHFAAYLFAPRNFAQGGRGGGKKRPLVGEGEEKRKKRNFSRTITLS